MSEPILRISSLEKSWGTTKVLHGIDVEASAGTILGLVGPNGVGKSTLLRCIPGVCYPDAGSVRVAGVDTRAHPRDARRNIGYLPGESSIYASMRGHELLAFGLAGYADIDRAFLDQHIARFDLPLDRKLRTYSAGQKQLLALAMTLAPRVPLYVLDEPDKALDASMRYELRQAIRRLRDRGAAVLISSHHIEELEGLADEFAFLLDGKLIDPVEIEAASTRLAAQVRVRFEPGVAPPVLGGVHAEPDRDGWIYRRQSPSQLSAVVAELLSQQPISLSFGRASLQDVYRALYLGSTPEAQQQTEERA